MITVILTIAIFSTLIFLLTYGITFSESKLVNKGDVKLNINNDKELTVESGITLLDTLTNNEILLPSACGGQGTCGVCKCEVLEGGGDILPTETGHVNRKEAKEGVRLACQVKVKSDMKIHVPEEIFSIKKWECEVVSNDNVSTYIKELVVKLPEGETIDFQSGGYIQIEAPKYDIHFGKHLDIEDQYRSEWEQNGMFNLHVRNSEEVVRAYSMANHPAEGNIIMLNVRIATPPWDSKKGTFANVPSGLMSTYIFSLKPGDTVTISGAYGEFFMQDTNREMMYIGGGAGMAPMRSHLFHLFHTLKTNRKVSFFYGARSKKEMFYQEQFEAIEKDFDNFTFHIGLSEPLPEDNWTGPTGFIHQVVYQEYLKNHPAPEDIEYYLCGPPVMVDAIEDMLYNLGVEPEMIMYDKF